MIKKNLILIFKLISASCIIFIILIYVILRNEEDTRLIIILPRQSILPNDTIRKFQQSHLEENNTNGYPNLYDLYWEFHNSSYQNPISVKMAENLLSKMNLWHPIDLLESDTKEIEDKFIAMVVWSQIVKPSSTKKIWMPGGFSRWFFTEENFQKSCPNLAKYCEYLNDSSIRTDGYDVVMYHFNELQIPSIYTKAIYILESNYNARASLTGRDILASYWRGSDVVTPYGKWVYYNQSLKYKPQDRNYASGKRKIAAIFVSNCRTPNNRLMYAMKLKSFIPVDIYGRCGDNQCQKSDAANCFQMLKTEYKFYLAFENSNCRDYITEKLFHNAYRNDIVPVVMGAHPDDYKAVAPENSYIHVEDFSSVRSLANYLIYLNRHDEEYNKYFQWKGTGEFVDTLFFCRFCGMMHYEDFVPRTPWWMEWSSAYARQTYCLPQNKIYWT